MKQFMLIWYNTFHSNTSNFLVKSKNTRKPFCRLNPRAVRGRNKILKCFIRRYIIFTDLFRLFSDCYWHTPSGSTVLAGSFSAFLPLSMHIEIAIKVQNENSVKPLIYKGLWGFWRLEGRCPLACFSMIWETRFGAFLFVNGWLFQFQTVSSWCVQRKCSQQCQIWKCMKWEHNHK